MQRIPITQAGLDELQKELDHLKKVERPNIIKAIAEARALGDLSENAEYHAAREKQSYIETRILFLQTQIAVSDIIVVNTEGSKTVVFGCKVTVLDMEDNTEEIYTLVGANEANPASGKISTLSPIGKALIGKAKNDIVEVATPGGALKLKVIDFS
jgi:transcription elongation factor GreA